MSMMWTEIAAKIAQYDKQRSQLRDSHHHRMVEAAKAYAAGKSSGAVGRMRRTSQHRFRLYPWTWLDLQELADVRNVPEGTLVGAIVEAITHLWSQNPHDEHLYLKRCDDPFDATACITSTPTDRPYVPSLETFADTTLRNFAFSAMRLLQQGHTARDLQAEIESISRALESVSNEP
jgi:hypothetical protein